MKRIDELIDEVPVIEIDMSYVGPVTGWFPVPPPDKMKELCEAARQHERRDNKKPPKPPRGKLIKFGSVVVENSLG